MKEIIKPFMIVLAVGIALVVGIVLGSYSKSGTEQFTTQQYLYEDIKATRGNIFADTNFQTAIHEMVTDFRGRPPISDDRKLVLPGLLINDSSFEELASSLALGAFDDPCPQVRMACVNKLIMWDESMAVARHMTSRQIDRETDDSIKKRKTFFINSGGPISQEQERQ